MLPGYCRCYPTCEIDTFIHFFHLDLHPPGFRQMLTNPQRHSQRGPNQRPGFSPV